MSMKNSWTENFNNYLNCMHHHEKWRCPVSPTLYFYHPWVRDYSWWWHHYLNYHFQVGWVVTCSHTGKHTLDCQNDVGLKRKKKSISAIVLLHALLVNVVKSKERKNLYMHGLIHILLFHNTFQRYVYFQFKLKFYQNLSEYYKHCIPISCRISLKIWMQYFCYYYYSIIFLW